ncbi:MAG: DNA-formamidopyrimidine glycosylase, partial [Promicromonosporaceae bacterium]|nr:DNA-formamidopyrimidine glycosylase [Promicromonosporaceae bacterium]
QARIYPQARTNQLGERQIGEVIGAATEIIGESLVAGGTSFDSLYVNASGEAGEFQNHLNVYGRAGEPCPRCGTPIERITLANRGTHLCPKCQRQ